MPDATITSSESTFGTISGSFSADQSTVTGTISGVITGTLTGSVGVPGPAGPGVPTGGTTGQVLAKVDGVDYNTEWVNASGGVWGTITGTLSNQTDLQTALNLKAPLASPALTGVPTAPTAATLTSTTQLATTAFVQQELAAGTAVAKNLEVYVRNQSGSTIAAGAIVYISGATGNRPLITLAQANNDANSAQTIGFVKASIANNGFGYVMVRGELENIDTSALTEGVQLYLSPTTAGAWTTSKPSAPQHLVYVGIVIRSHPTQGVILVAVQNGYELNELHDVAISSPTNGQVLKYDSATSLWKNATDSSGVAWGGITGTLSSQTDLQSALDGKYSTSNPSGYITSSALTGYATQAWVDAQGYLQAGALTGYALESWVTSQGYLTSASLTGYATESWVTSQGYLTSAPVLSVAGKTGSVTLDNTDISGLGTMATASTSDYSTTTVANGLYYPLSSNPSSYLVAADIAGKANSASPSLTGNVTITTNSTSPALFIEQSGTGNILTLHDQASDTTFVAIDQNGKIATIASTTTNAGFNVPHGTAPTTPVNGDIWTTTSGLFMRQNGSTKQYVDLDGTQTINGTKTFSASSQTLGNSTATGTISVGTGATLSGSTKTVNIGTGGVAGSTTNIAIGSTTGTSTTTLQGITNGVTQSAGDSSLKLATTAFVTTANNLKANISSPTFTGVPAAPTASAGTNTTQIATTAFVTAAVPTFASLTEARQFSNTTKVLSPSLALWSMLSADIVYIQRNAFTVTNVGSVQYVNAGAVTTETRLASAAASSSRARTFGAGQVDQSQSMTVRSNPSGFLNFSKPTYLSGRSNTYDITDAVLTMAFYYGKAEADGVGDLTRRGIGWKVTGGSGSRFLTLQVHNGTTLTSVTSSYAVVGGTAFDWDIISDGAGNVTLYVNGASVATSSAGPTGLVNLTPVIWQEEYSTSGVPAITFHTAYHSRGRLAIINY